MNTAQGRRAERLTEHSSEWCLNITRMLHEAQLGTDSPIVLPLPLSNNTRNANDKTHHSNRGWGKRNTDTCLIVISSGTVSRHQPPWLIVTRLLPSPVAFAPTDKAGKSTRHSESPWIWQMHLSTHPGTSISCMGGSKWGDRFTLRSVENNIARH